MTNEMNDQVLFLSTYANHLKLRHDKLVGELVVMETKNALTEQKLQESMKKVSQLESEIEKIHRSALAAEDSGKPTRKTSAAKKAN